MEELSNMLNRLLHRGDEEEIRQRKADEERERRLQDATIAIKRKFGKNALIRGMSLEEGATAMERNNQIGGHKA